MSAWSLTRCFQIGFIPHGTEKLMPDMLEFDVRLSGLIEIAFDTEVNQRRISIPRDDKIDHWLSVVYQSYIYYRNRFGPQPIQVYRDITEWFAEDLRRVHNITRGYNHRGHFRNLPTNITRKIVQTITLNAWNALEAIKQQIIQEAELLRKRIAVRKISDIFRNWKARKVAATRIQCAFRDILARRIAQRLKLRKQQAVIILQAAIRGWKVRLELRRLYNNMTLVAAQNRTAAQIRDALKIQSFYGDSIEEVGTFLIHMTDVLTMNSWVHKMLNATDPVGGGDRAVGWLPQYRREVLAIALNFRGQAALWWAREVRESRAAVPAVAATLGVPAVAAQPVFYTPLTWSTDIYTHPDNNAAGPIEYPGLFRIIETYFVNTAPLAHPNYKQIDWSPVRFSGKSSEIDLFNQTVRAIATQNNLPWNPFADPPQQLPAQHGCAIIAGIAARFTGAAAEWWFQTPLAKKPTQIEVNIQGVLPEGVIRPQGLLNQIEIIFRSMTHNLEQLRIIQTIKWDENEPLVEFNLRFSQILRNAQQHNTDSIILIDYYCKTLPQGLAKSVQDSLDLLAVVQSVNVNLHIAIRLAIQKNATQWEFYSSEKNCLKCGKKGHIARFCNTHSILETAGKAAKQI